MQVGETWQVFWQKERHLERKILKMAVEKKRQLKMGGGAGDSICGKEYINLTNKEIFSQRGGRKIAETLDLWRASQGH